MGFERSEHLGGREGGLAACCFDFDHTLKNLPPISPLKCNTKIKEEQRKVIVLLQFFVF